MARSTVRLKTPAVVASCDVERLGGHSGCVPSVVSIDAILSATGHGTA